MSVGTRGQPGCAELGTPRAGGNLVPRELVPSLLSLPTFLGSPHCFLLDLLEQPLVDGTVTVPPSQVHGQQDTGIRRLLEIYRFLHALEQLGDLILRGHWKEEEVSGILCPIRGLSWFSMGG